MKGKFPTKEQLKRKCGWLEIPPAGVILRAASALDNKTGSWRAFRPVLDSSKCINCMVCVVYCPDNAISVKNEKRTGTNLDYCKGCGVCSQACPAKAIKMEEEAKFNK